MSIWKSGLKTTIFRFNLKDRLQRHLLSPTFADPNNLDLPIPHGDESPFDESQNRPTNCNYKSFTQGEWYKNLHHKYEPLLKTGHYLLHPLAPYMDKTGVDNLESNTLEPFMFTSPILTQSAREKVENWILAGYIPSLKWLHQQRSRSTTTSKRSIAIRDYHHCLAKLIEPLKEIQKENPVFLFRRGSETVGAFRIIAPLEGMTGDNLSNDQLAQCVANKTETCPWLSRRCLCPATEADKPIHKCLPLLEVFV